MHLDVSRDGGCVNMTISQNVTFGEQGLPFGINAGPGKKGAAAAPLSTSLWITSAAVLAVLFCVLNPAAS